MRAVVTRRKAQVALGKPKGYLSPMGFTKSIGSAFRRFRDERLIRPIAQSHRFRRISLRTLDVAVLDFGDHRLAFDPKDSIIGESIQKRGGWFREETLRIFNAIPKRGGIFVDVGANIGTQTIYALKHGGFDHAVCFEPSSHNVRILKVSALLNGVEDRITVVQKAVGAKAGTADLFLTENSTGTFTLAKDRGHGSVTVPVVTAEEELRSLGVKAADIGLAWIDVEGFEGDVLEGWPSLKGVPVCLEYSPDMKVLPVSTFSGWSQWADARATDIRWQPIETLTLPEIEQADILLK